MKTLLQKITDTLERDGISISAIKTFPPDDEGSVSVSLTVNKKSECHVERLKKALTKKINMEGPCHSCADPSCENCPTSPINSDPIEVYTPEEAVRAMLAGKKLRNEKGWIFSWRDWKGGEAFIYQDNNGDIHSADDFSGLYSMKVYSG